MTTPATHAKKGYRMHNDDINPKCRPGKGVPEKEGPHISVVAESAAHCLSGVLTNKQHTYTAPGTPSKDPRVRHWLQTATTARLNRRISGLALQFCALLAAHPVAWYAIDVAEVANAHKAKFGLARATLNELVAEGWLERKVIDDGMTEGGRALHRLSFDCLRPVGKIRQMRRAPPTRKRKHRRGGR